MFKRKTLLNNQFISRLSGYKKKRGFSLVEISIVIVVIAILFVVLLSRTGFAERLAKESGVKNDFRVFSVAAEQALIENSGIDGFDDIATLAEAMNENLDESMQFDETGTSALADPWNRAYKVTLENPESPNGEIVITCAGLDALYGTDDDYYLSAKYVDGEVSISTSGFTLDIGEAKITSSATGDGKNVNGETAEALFKWNGTVILGFADECPEEAKKNVVIPSKCTAIASGAFLEERNTQTIELGKNMSILYESTFGDWFSDKLEKIIIPANITSFSGEILSGTGYWADAYYGENANGVVDAFQELGDDSENCSFVEIEVAKDNPNYMSYDGCLYTKSGDTLLYVPPGKTSIKYHENLTTIGTGAFHNTLMKEITIPEGVTVMENAVFAVTGSIGTGNTLTRVKKVNLPSTLTTIGYNCLHYISNLYIPDNVINLGEKAIVVGHQTMSSNDILNVSLPEHLKSTESKWLKDNTSGSANITYRTKFKWNGNTITGFADGLSDEDMKNIVIPEHCTAIADNAFSNNRTIETIYISGDLSSIGQYAFAGSGNNSESSKIIIDGNVTTIKQGAFTATNYKSIEINGSSTTFEGSYIFSNSKIESLRIPEGITKLTDYSCQGCTSLTKVILPSTLNTISNSAFFNCTSLASIEIPEGVTTINNGAFNSCTSLKEITLPTTLTNVYAAPFSKCSALEIIHAPYSLKDIDQQGYTSEFFLKNGNSATVDWGVTDEDIFTWNGTTITGFNRNSGVTKITIPEKCTAISQGVFSSSNIESVIITDNVTSIGDGAFYGCKNLKSVNIGNGVKTIGSQSFSYCTDLTSLKFGQSLTTLGSSSFQYCNSLTSVTLPDNVTNVYGAPFANCTALKTISAPFALKDISQQGYTSEFFLTYNNSATVNWRGTDSSYFNWSGTTITGLSTAGQNAGLTSISIPDNCTTIAANAIRGNGTIKSIIVPGSVKTIESGAFANMSNLTTVVLNDGVTTLKDGAFYSDSSLTSITLSSTLTTIGISAFGGCTSLKNIAIPNSVTSIGQNAFSNCTSLTNIVLPGGIKTISTALISECPKLTTITIGEGITSITNYAFARLAALKTVNLPSTLTEISNGAFQNCTGLTSITIPDNVTNVYGVPFGGCSSLTSISAPSALKDIDQDGSTSEFFLTLGNNATITWR